ncbi:MAG TPA: M1 family metallopeptidase [Kofleriaceae bacterium]|nr:M1 family metallopeptidase [Kofleriaceae bacterium]
MKISSGIVFGLGLGVIACHAAQEPVVTPPGPPPAEIAVAPPAVAVAVAVVGGAPAVAAPAAEPTPLGPLPADVHPTHEALALTIDPEAAGLRGTADIALHLDRPRRQIWLHGRDLRVSFAELATLPGHNGAPDGSAARTGDLRSPSTHVIPARWDQADPSGVVRIVLPAEVSGDVLLRVAFEADYDPQLVGVYRVKTRSGPAVFSKFEAIYARRAFPCFDEPAFKIPYDVTLTVPAGAAVVGNMPIAAVAAVDPGHQRVTLATTPPLPSYLIAFAVGPFDTRATTLAASLLRPAALPIGAVAIRGRGDDTAFALGLEPALVAEQERYFGVAFPFPKLDLVAVPDFQSGAMENAGAITFRDSLLLVDDKVTSLDQRIAVASVLAHETAHQWFGDLVTMRWWNDLWLNEGFATFLAARTLEAVRPELEAELGAANRVNTVMRIDSLASARRIRQPIETPHDITNAFDGITYDKGAAVLGMVAHFVGDEPFRRGLHALLTAHASGSITTDELIGALSAAAGRELAPLVASFLDQPGVPVVTATPACLAGKGSVGLRQARWRPAGSLLAADATWVIPVCVRAGIGPRIVDACTVLDAPAGSLALPGCPDWVLPNAQAAGYYRSTLPVADLSRLRGLGLPRLAVAERVMLGRDLEAAFDSAALPGDDVLRALEPFARDRHGAVATVPLGLWGDLDEFFVDAGQRAALRAKLGRLTAPVVAALGWTPAVSEPAWRRLLRGALFGFLAAQDQPAVLAEAARRGRRLLGLDRDHVRHPDAVAPDLAGIALAAAARTGGAVEFDAIAAELAHSDDAQVRQRLLAALASARDPALLGRALDLAIAPGPSGSGPAGLRGNERIAVLTRLLGKVATRDLAWRWLVAHYDALMPLLPDRFGGFIPSSIALCDPQHAAEVRAFFTPRVDKLTGGPRNLAQALERADQCAARVAAQHDAVARYLR